MDRFWGTSECLFPPQVNWIAQFDLPQQAEEYVHRIGRTARLGKEGNALLFVLDCEAGMGTMDLEKLDHEYIFLFLSFEFRDRTSAPHL